jgi:hypothetical protein
MNVLRLGAICPDGKTFNSVVNESKWSVESIKVGGHFFRLIECPIGYTISKDDSFPDQDRCVQCPSGMYSIVVANSTSISCHLCPLGAQCPGGSIVEAQKGFWRREGGQAQTVEVFRCPPGFE